LNSGGFTMGLGGNWSNAGTFSGGSDTVIFEGSSAQTIGGSTSTTFKHISIDNSSGVSISSAQSLTGTLTLTSGTLTTGGLLTLVSNSSGTARIAEITGGAISGDITMQRYVTSGSNSWRFLSSAVSGQTLANWDDDFGTSGFPGSDDPAMSFTSIYTYDETVFGGAEFGYVAPTDISNPITVGKGYWVYLGPLPMTFAVTGPANTGGISLPITYTDDPAVGDTSDGWNMVGNPYPSSIDWDAAGWTKTNVNTTIYILKENGDYASYPAGGPGTNGGTKDIASSQAFWIQTNAASPALSVTESVKSSTDVAFLKTSGTPDHIKLRANANGFSDETVIRLMPGANVGMDNQDGYKLNNSNPLTPNISSGAGSSDFVINTLPDTIKEFSIPIEVYFNGPGSYDLDIINEMSNVPNSSCLLLEDLQTGAIVDLKVDSTYTFSASSLTANPRFMVHLTAPFSINGFNASCAGSSDGYAVAAGQGSGPWDYTWLDANGDTIKYTNNSTQPDTAFGLPQGLYTAIVDNTSGLCGEVYDIITIDEPIVITGNITQSDPSCYGDNTGSIDLSVTGGTETYTYIWSNSEITEDLSNLIAGTYNVTITDGNGCTKMIGTTINQPESILLTALTSNLTCYGSANGTIDLSITGGTTPYSIVWSNGSTSEDISNLSADNYQLTITDNNNCITQQTYPITEPLPVKADFVMNTDTTYLNQGGMIQFQNNSSNASVYNWNFGDGSPESQIISPTHAFVSAGTFTVRLISEMSTCSDTLFRDAVVLSTNVGLDEINTSINGITIQFDDNEVTIITNFDSEREITISVHNILGQKLLPSKTAKMKQAQLNLDISHIPNGIYFVTVQLDEDEKRSWKIKK